MHFARLICALILSLSIGVKLPIILNGELLSNLGIDLITGIGLGALIPLVTLLELICLFALVCAKSSLFKFLPSFVLSLCFLAYHAVKYATGIKGVCPCLLGISALQHVPGRYLDIIAIVTASALALASGGSYIPNKSAMYKWAHSELVVSATGSRLLPLVVAVFTISWLVLLLSLPIGNIFEAGSDESFEISAAWEISQGSVLYVDVWSNQPPLYISILSSCIKLFPDNPFPLRLFSVLCSALALAVVVVTAYRVSGPVGATAAVLVLAGAPTFLTLSLSAMREVPQLAFGALGSFLFLRSIDRHSAAGAVCGGLCVGIALMIKITSGIFLLALMVSVLLSFARFPSARMVIFQLSGYFTIGICIVTVLSISANTSISISHLFSPHIIRHAVDNMDSPNSFAPSFPSMIAPLGLSGFGLVCVLIVARGMTLDRFCMATWCSALFIAQVIIASVYRPWWEIYNAGLYLSFAILIPYAISSEACRKVMDLTQIGWQSRVVSISICTYYAIVVAICMVVISRGIDRIVFQRQWLDKADKTDNSPVLAFLRQRLEVDDVLYSEPNIMPFHVKRRTVPFALNGSYVRFWSGEITEESLGELVVSAAPKAIVLPQHKSTALWKSLMTDYKIEYEDGIMRCWIRQ